MLKIRKGTTAQRLTETPAEARLVLDTSTKTVYVGDGSQVGGIKVGGAGDTTDYTIYAVTTALGGTATGSGRQLENGTTTATSANKLVNTNAAFTTALVNKTVYNTTDGTWAKITARDSATQLSLSANIMAVSEDYVICDAVDSLSAAYAIPDTPYNANVTIRFSPGTFSGDATLIGKIAGSDKTITIQGDNIAGAGGTTISGVITIYDKVTIAGGSNYKLTFTNRVDLRGTANVTWSYAQTTGSSAKVFVYNYAVNTFSNAIMTFGNDPGTYTETSSTITKGYTMLVASTGVGFDSNAEACAIHAGTATSTTANKLVDSTANFGTDCVGMVLWNSTDDTWTTVTARDSATQLSIAANIMANGEAYQLGDAFLTIQKAINEVPGTVNCDTTVKASGDTFSQSLLIKGKALSGAYNIKLLGTWNAVLSGGTVSSATAGSNTANATLTKTGAGWTVDAHKGALVKFDDNTSTAALRGKIFTIKSNTADTLTIVGAWVNGFGTTPSASDTCTIVRPGTTIDLQVKSEAAQKSIIYERLRMYIPGQSGTVSCYVDDNSGATLNYCETSQAAGDRGGIITLQNCYMHGNTPRQLYAFASAIAAYRRCLITGDDSSYGNKMGIDVAASGQAGAGSDTSVIRNFVEGLKVRSNATGGLYNDGNVTKTQIENNTTGVKAEEGGQATFVGTGYVAYSGNTTDQNAVSASYGYIA